jgi:hypothetical protein
MASFAATILQLALTLLMSMQGNASITAAQQQQAISVATEAIQLATQAMQSGQSVSQAQTQIPSNPALATYTDKNGVFSFQYPSNFSVGLDNDGLTGTTSAGLVGQGLVEVDSPQNSNLFPGTDFGALSIDVQYSTSTDQASCDSPNAGPAGVTQSTIGGTTWYEGATGSAAAGTEYSDDFYQSYQSGACWIVHFQWKYFGGELGMDSATPVQSLSEENMSTFEQSTLASFRLLDSGGTPYVMSN